MVERRWSYFLYFHLPLRHPFSLRLVPNKPPPYSVRDTETGIQPTPLAFLYGAEISNFPVPRK